MTQYLKPLHFACIEHDTRPNMALIKVKDGYAIATNGYMIVKLDLSITSTLSKELIKLQKEESEKKLFYFTGAKPLSEMEHKPNEAIKDRAEYWMEYGGKKLVELTANRKKFLSEKKVLTQEQCNQAIEFLTVLSKCLPK